MGGSADGGCPVSSTWDNYGGRKLDDGGCLTVVDMFEVKKFYGQVTIDVLHRFCARSFKGGKLLSFTDSQKLQMLDGVNFKQAVASNILIHPGVQIFETNITMKQNVHVEKCGKTKRLSCDGYPYEYISNGNGTVDDMRTADLIFSRNSEIRHCRNSSILLLNPWATLVLLLCHLVADSYNSLACLATCHAAIRGHHIRKETSFERVLRTGLEQRKAVIAQYDAKHKFGNEKGNTQKSSSSAVGSRKKSKSKKARASHRDASRRRKLNGRNSRSRRSRSQSNSRHRSRSRSRSRSNSAS
ncbi:hypothetical protein T06_14830 [Trichinella sp. T6]|nr:hypothetical protein T06_14830 [Trichinella sp. T6]